MDEEEEDDVVASVSGDGEDDDGVERALSLMEEMRGISNKQQILLSTSLHFAWYDGCEVVVSVV